MPSFNHNLDGLFTGSFWGGRGGKIPPLPPRLKLVRIMLETSNLARKYRHICSFRKYTFRDFLVLLSVFVRQKVTITKKITFADCVRNPASGLLQTGKNPKNDNDITTSRHDINVNFFWRWFVSLVKFSYWSKFHVNIITGSGIMTIFFYKGLTRNPEIGNTPVWVLPNIWKLGRFMDAKVGLNVSNRMLMKAATFQGYSFYRFWVIKAKPTGRGKITPSHPD